MAITKTMPAGHFKQGCLQVLDQVAARKFEVVITKRGKPVAKLVPLASNRETEAEILADLRGQVRQLVSDEEFMAPIDWGKDRL